jgi:methionyl aminopeptidase
MFNRKITRNDLCWCGSGIKYKKCHMEQDDRLKELRSQGIPVPGRKLIKTDAQIEGIRKACQLSKKIMDTITDKIKEGITTNDINEWVHELTISNGAVPATLGYNGYPKSVCTSLNNVICHGIPDNTVLKDGDILNVDITCLLEGYYGDMSRMFLIGNPSDEAKQLVRVAEECMYKGIEAVKPFNRTGHIGYAIEQHAKQYNYSVVQNYGGHGTGNRFHEDPFVQHYGKQQSGMVLVPNMVFTVEPMINIGTHRCKVLADDWTAVTEDGSLSAQWEHTVRVTDDGVEILTI